MFTSGDKVVMNGFRARCTDNQHMFGTNHHMERWESDRTVLTVGSVVGDTVLAEGPVSLSAHCITFNSTFNFDRSELRYATRAEIEAAEKAAEPEQPEQPKIRTEDLATGMVVKLANGGHAILGDGPDSDSDFIASTMEESGFPRIYYVAADEVEAILGKITDSGLELHGSIASHTHTITMDPAGAHDHAAGEYELNIPGRQVTEWREGDVFKVVANGGSWFPVGERFTVTTWRGRTVDDAGWPYARDMDGDVSPISPRRIKLVSRAADTGH